ncbi:hypothetical protein ACWD3J_32815 [Streptomyces sp. NPDC002755]|uniref:hypothetical protein n=1 Tax=Streptomyces sp. NPDC002884 TaxID=3154544 RepID=UPI0033279443
MTTTDSEDIDNGNTAPRGHGNLSHEDPGTVDLHPEVTGSPTVTGHRVMGSAAVTGHGGAGSAAVTGHGGTGHEVMGEDEAAKGIGFTSAHLRVLVGASGWPALAATAVPGPSPLRWIPVLLFVLFGPGCAALYPQPGRLASGARLEAIALAAPISLSLGVLAATSLFLVEAFSMTAFLVSLACFTTVTAALPGLPLPAARRGAVERAKVRRRPSGGSET